MGKLTYAIKKATENDINLHLKKCAVDFFPPLNEKVNIKTYSKKISAKAITFEAWIDKNLDGLIETYFNDKAMAFITNVSVTPQNRKKGIAAELLERCINYARQHGFKEIKLEVSKNNTTAISFYKKKGFSLSEVNDESLTMKLQLI